MNCNCIDEMNEKLAAKNGKLSVTLAFPRDGSPTTLLPTIMVEKIVPRGQRPPIALPSYCPFCGVSYTESRRTTEPKVAAG